MPLIDVEPHERERFTVRKGDLLVCEGRHLARCAIWVGDLEVCGFQKALHRLRPIDREADDPQFLSFVMVIANATDAFHRNLIDNSIPHLTGEMLRGHRFAFPPMREQQEIVAYLETHSERFKRAISRTQSEIALLTEYRTRLIADIVTGKLDVREAAARLPDVQETPVDDESPSEEDETPEDAPEAEEDSP